MNKKLNFGNKTKVFLAKEIWLNMPTINNDSSIRAECCNKDIFAYKEVDEVIGFYMENELYTNLKYDSYFKISKCKYSEKKFIELLSDNRLYGIIIPYKDNRFINLTNLFEYIQYQEYIQKYNGQMFIYRYKNEKKDGKLFKDELSDLILEVENMKKFSNFKIKKFVSKKPSFRKWLEGYKSTEEGEGLPSFENSKILIPVGKLRQEGRIFPYYGMIIFWKENYLYGYNLSIIPSWNVNRGGYVCFEGRSFYNYLEATYMDVFNFDSPYSSYFSLLPNKEILFNKIISIHINAIIFYKMGVKPSDFLEEILIKLKGEMNNG